MKFTLTKKHNYNNVPPTGWLRPFFYPLPLRQEKTINNQRNKIIEVASQLMSQKGYNGTSIQEIADHVGIHKTTVFHYFRNKEELLIAIAKVGLEENLEELKNLLKNKEWTPQEKFKQAIFIHLHSISNHQNNISVYLSDSKFLSKEKKAKYRKKGDQYKACFEEVIKDIIPTLFPGLDSRIVTLGILGMLNWTVMWYKKTGRYNIDEIANIFHQMVIKKD